MATAVEEDSSVSDLSQHLRDSNLLRRLRAVIKSASRVDISNDLCPETSVTNRHYCSLILNGLAVMRARTLGTTVERIYLTPNILRVGHPVGLRHADEVEAVDVSRADAAELTPLEVGARRRRASASSVAPLAEAEKMLAAAAEATAKAEAELAAAASPGGGRRRSRGTGGNAAARRRSSLEGTAHASAATNPPEPQERGTSILFPRRSSANLSAVKVSLLRLPQHQFSAYRCFLLKQAFGAMPDIHLLPLGTDYSGESREEEEDVRVFEPGSRVYEPGGVAPTGSSGKRYSPAMTPETGTTVRAHHPLLKQRSKEGSMHVAAGAMTAEDRAARAVETDRQRSLLLRLTAFASNYALRGAVGLSSAEAAAAASAAGGRSSPVAINRSKRTSAPDSIGRGSSRKLDAVSGSGGGQRSVNLPISSRAGRLAPVRQDSDRGVPSGGVNARQAPTVRLPSPVAPTEGQATTPAKPVAHSTAVMRPFDRADGPTLSRAESFTRFISSLPRGKTVEAVPASQLDSQRDTHRDNATGSAVEAHSNSPHRRFSDGGLPITGLSQLLPAASLTNFREDDASMDPSRSVTSSNVKVFLAVPVASPDKVYASGAEVSPTVQPIPHHLRPPFIDTSVNIHASDASSVGGTETVGQEGHHGPPLLPPISNGATPLSTPPVTSSRLPTSRVVQRAGSVSSATSLIERGQSLVNPWRVLSQPLDAPVGSPTAQRGSQPHTASDAASPHSVANSAVAPRSLRISGFSGGSSPPFVSTLVAPFAVPAPQSQNSSGGKKMPASEVRRGSSQPLVNQPPTAALLIDAAEGDPGSLARLRTSSRSPAAYIPPRVRVPRLSGPDPIASVTGTSGWVNTRSAADVIADFDAETQRAIIEVPAPEEVDDEGPAPSAPESAPGQMLVGKGVLDLGSRPRSLSSGPRVDKGARSDVATSQPARRRSVDVISSTAAAISQSEELSQRFRYLGKSRVDPVPSPSIHNFSSTGTPLPTEVGTFALDEPRERRVPSRNAEGADRPVPLSSGLVAPANGVSPSAPIASRSRRTSAPAATAEDVPLLTPGSKPNAGLAISARRVGETTVKAAVPEKKKGRRFSLKAAVNRVRMMRRSMGAFGGNKWAQSTVATKLGDEEDDVSGVIAGLDLRNDDVGPEVMMDPTSAAVFSCIPSAVEQWVVQQWSFRVLFMDAVLLRSAAEEFGCEMDVEVISPRKPVSPANVSPASHAKAATAPGTRNRSPSPAPPFTRSPQPYTQSPPAGVSTAQCTRASQSAHSLIPPDCAPPSRSTPSNLLPDNMAQTSTAVLGTVVAAAHIDHVTRVAQMCVSESPTLVEVHEPSEANHRIVGLERERTDRHLLPGVPLSRSLASVGPNDAGTPTDTPTAVPLVRERRLSGLADHEPRTQEQSGNVPTPLASQLVSDAVPRQHLSPTVVSPAGVRPTAAHDDALTKSLVAEGRRKSFLLSQGRHGADGMRPGERFSSKSTTLAEGNSSSSYESASIKPPPSVAGAGASHSTPAPKDSHSPAKAPQVVIKSDPAFQNAAVRKQVIMAILFADIVGYSKMGEMQVLTFVERFLGSVAALLDMLPSIGIKGCATKNTWGDAIYMVFSRVPDAGTVALLLSDLVQRVPWHKLGLPKSLSIRISLHAAPVHPVVDPITNTKAFAAIAETLCVTQYECTYVGNVPLAKGYGLQPVYHVRWGNSLAGRRLQDVLVDNRSMIMPVLPAGRSEEESDAVRTAENAQT